MPDRTTQPAETSSQEQRGFDSSPTLLKPKALFSTQDDSRQVLLQRRVAKPAAESARRVGCSRKRLLKYHLLPCRLPDPAPAGPNPQPDTFRRNHQRRSRVCSVATNPQAQQWRTTDHTTRTSCPGEWTRSDTSCRKLPWFRLVPGRAPPSHCINPIATRTNVTSQSPC